MLYVTNEMCAKLDQTTGKTTHLINIFEEYFTVFQKDTSIGRMLIYLWSNVILV